jgi:hypothetical protein
VSSSTVLIEVAVDPLKPSATITRPSASVPCACPERFSSNVGPALKVPLLMVKMWVVLPATKAPVEPSVISSWPVPNGEMPP